MIGQIWGARVLQSGGDLPDCDANDDRTRPGFGKSSHDQDRRESTWIPSLLISLRGEYALICRPRSLLLIGSGTSSFARAVPHVPKFESFERFHRSSGIPRSLGRTSYSVESSDYLGLPDVAQVDGRLGRSERIPRYTDPTYRMHSRCRKQSDSPLNP
jgi:hypothetical protein